MCKKWFLAATAVTQLFLTSCINNPSTLTSHSFNGVWGSSIPTNDGTMYTTYTIHQNKNKACGWRYKYELVTPPNDTEETPYSAGWATPVYEEINRWEGIVSHNKLMINKLCRDTTSICPLSTHTNAIKKHGKTENSAAIKTGWLKVSEQITICSDQLFHSQTAQPKNCNEMNKKEITILTKGDPSGRVSETLSSFSNSNPKEDDAYFKTEWVWLKACLQN